MIFHQHRVTDWESEMAGDVEVHRRHHFLTFLSDSWPTEMPVLGKINEDEFLEAEPGYLVCAFVTISKSFKHGEEQVTVADIDNLTTIYEITFDFGESDTHTWNEFFVPSGTENKFQRITTNF